MEDEDKTKEQLIKELLESRQQIAELKTLETEHKRVEEALRNSSELLEKIFAAFNFMIAYMDTDFNFIRVNRAYAEVDGCETEFFVGKNHFDLYPNEENTAIFRRVVETGEPFSTYAKPFEYAEHPERGVTYWDWTLQPVKDSSGEVEGVVLCLVDVTERKRAEEELKKYHNHLEELVEERTAELIRTNERLQREIAERKRAEEEIENLAKLPGENPNPVLRIARDSTLLYANQSSQPLLQLWGYETDQRLPGDWHKFILECLTSDSNEEIEVACGDTTYSLALTPIIDADYVNVYARDITKRKQAEEQLQRHAADLEEINEELKNFAYTVSHDLRAPLASIKGFSEVLGAIAEESKPTLDKCLPHLDEEERAKLTATFEKNVPQAIGFIDSSVNRMDSLISAILKLARLGLQELNLEPINTEALVQSILNSMAHQIEQHGVTVTVGALPEIVADPVSMGQIMGNLLDNALKYLEPGRPGKIEVSAEHSAEGTTFHIQDNGRGIAEEDIQKVFDIFYRAGKQGVPGEGMGLAYVKTLIRRHGGRIWCESEPGVGTTFSFTIPRQPGPADLT